MLRDLVMDSVAHWRECLVLSAAILPALFAGFFYLKKSGDKADLRVKALVLYSLIGTLLILIPVNAALLRMVTGTYHDAPDMWIVIPVIPLGAVCISALFGQLFSGEHKSERGKACLSLILLLCAVLVCGSLGNPGERTSEAEDISESDRQIAEFVSDKRLIGGGMPVILASDDMIAYLHTYDPDICTLYGRDMWDGRLTKNRYGTYSEELIGIHNDMQRIENGETDLAPDLCRRAFAAGADLVILPPVETYKEIKAAGFDVVGFNTREDMLYYIVTRRIT